MDAQIQQRQEIALLLDAIAGSNDKEEIKELAGQLRETVLNRRPETNDGKNCWKWTFRSLYRYEHIAPEKLIKGLHRLVEEKKISLTIFHQ